MKATLTLDQFRSAFRSGGLHSISVMASGGHFFVTARPRSGGRVTLATTHGKRFRSFRNPAKAIAILHEMGAHKVEVDTSAWSPAQAELEARKRPDTAERQRRAYEAAEHDAWFRSEVEASLREAGSSDAQWVSQEDMKRQSMAKRVAWLAGTTSTKKATA